MSFAVTRPAQRPFRTVPELRILTLVTLIFLLVQFGLLLERVGASTIIGGMIFSLSILGFFRPKMLLYSFIFLMALKHREFTYLSISIPGGAKLFISEWILFILLATSVPHVRRVYAKYRHYLYSLTAYLLIGLAVFAATKDGWSLMSSMRNFVIVYYSLFIVVVLAHFDTADAFKKGGLALIAGTVPNLFAEWCNFLYGTFPSDWEQRNFSVRNAYYYMISLCLIVPYLMDRSGKYFTYLLTYVFAALLLILLYSYSKTPMFAVLIISAVFAAFNRESLNRRTMATAFAVVLILLMMEPSGKDYKFSELFDLSTYQKDRRLLMDISVLRDFCVYPYGIGFGAPIFGENTHIMVRNADVFHSLHNSFLNELRRMGFEGFVLFLVLIGMPFVTAVKTIRSTEPFSEMHRLAIGGFLAFMTVNLYSFAHVVLEGPFFGIPYWMIAGFLMSLPILHEKTKGQKGVSKSEMLDNQFRDI